MGFTADGIVPDDHFPGTRFVLVHPAVGEIPIATIAERPNPTRKATTADGKMRSQGETDPQSTTFTVAVGNDAVRQSLRAAVEAARGNVAPGYKADAQLIIASISGARTQTETLQGAWFSDNTRPALDKTPGAADQDLRETFELSYDDIVIQYA